MPASASAGTPSSALRESLLVAPSAFADRLRDLRHFDFLVDMHSLLHDLVNAQLPLQRRRTAVSDAEGVWRAVAGAPPFQGAEMRVQTLSGPPPLDWAHQTFAVAPGFGYSKTSLLTADSCLTPHLELELCAGGEQGSSVLLYLNLSPRASMTLHPHYIRRYYQSPPPPPAGGGTAGDAAAAAAAAGGTASWWDLEARAAASPGFTRFVSSSPDVRAFSATAVLFNVEMDDGGRGRAAAESVVREAASIWLAWVAAGGANSAEDAAAVGAALGPDAVPSTASEQQQLLREMAARSAAWRRFPRREAAASAMVAAFGKEVMEDYWDSMAGDARIRADGCSSSDGGP